VPCRSYLDQTLSYFNDRPHVGVPAAPRGGAAAWRADDFDGPGAWSVELTAAQRDELAGAGRALVAGGTDLGGLSRGDVELPWLQPLIAATRAELADGRGFALWRGFPVDELSSAECEAAFWALGLHLGLPGAQNGEGDLLGHVTDHHDPPGTPRAREYRSTVDIDFHCDAADVVGLLCVATATEGGSSRLVSSVAVFDALLAETPDLAARLCETCELDTRSDGEGFAHVPVQPVCFDGEHLRTFMHQGYLRSAARHPDVTLDDRLLRALDGWSEIAARRGAALDMQLRSGDLQLCSNHTVAHARAGYVDDPAHPRHLLRLWLTLD